MLRRWIADGAEYQPHWSLIPPKRPELPVVRDTAWVRGSIDRFILAKLEANGLRPAPEADRRTLARRLALDLTGLPPDPAVVESLCERSRTQRLSKRLVTRFLDTPQWGEHRARYWLDSARYADTNGYHFDNFREAWAFRDWVIGAFNRNLTFDRFTIEQLAGDLLPGSTLDQQVASGIQPMQRDHQRRGRHPRGIPGPLHPRPHRDGLTSVDGPDRRLRGLPRSQVRPDQPARVLRAVGVLQQHDAADHGRQRQGHAADRLCPRCGRSIALASALDRARWKPGAVWKLANRPLAADFTKWLATADPRTLEAMIPTGGLQLAALDRDDRRDPESGKAL